MTHAMKHNLAYFDLLRGWAAVVVFLHHASILGGGPAFFNNEQVGAEAVNIFMFASGFLIFYQASISHVYAGLKTKMGMASFYIRRFFRISPAYYVCLFIALLLSTFLGESRLAIGQSLPDSLTSMDRYFIQDYVTNFTLHVTYLFGFMPSFVLLSTWAVLIPAANQFSPAKCIQYLSSHRSSKFLAEMSYSVYIFHLLLMLPFFSVALSYNPAHNPLIWVLQTMLLFALVCCVAWIIYKWVELPGIELGKACIKRLHS